MMLSLRKKQQRRIENWQILRLNKHKTTSGDMLLGVTLYTTNSHKRSTGMQNKEDLAMSVVKLLGLNLYRSTRKRRKKLSTWLKRYWHCHPQNPVLLLPHREGQYGEEKEAEYEEVEVEWNP